MAGLIKREGATSWVAIIKENADSRKQCRKSTFVRVQQDGKREAQTKKEAKAVADGYEAVYRGRILYTAQADIFRRQAGTTADEQKALGKRLDVLRELGTAGGMARRMPTVREYLEEYTPTGGVKNRASIVRALSLFLNHLGKAVVLYILNNCLTQPLDGEIIKQSYECKRCLEFRQFKHNIIYDNSFSNMLLYS